jgi:hypothetical protein
MGYIEETGAAQHFRDARIASIYEGTNGIQAIDLVMRKLPLAGGATVRAVIAQIKRTAAAVAAADDAAFGASAARLGEAGTSLERATDWLLARSNDPDTALAGATPYLRLFALAAGGALLADEALAARQANDGAAARIALARFFAENLMVQADGLERAVLEGAASVNGADAALAG